MPAVLTGPPGSQEADRKDGEMGRRGRTDGEHAGPPVGPGVCELQQFSGVPWAPLLWGFSAGPQGRRKVKASGQPHTSPRAALGARQARLPARIPLRTRGIGRGVFTRPQRAHFRESSPNPCVMQTGPWEPAKKTRGCRHPTLRGAVCTLRHASPSESEDKGSPRSLGPPGAGLACHPHHGWAWAQAWEPAASLEMAAGGKPEKSQSLRVTRTRPSCHSPQNPSPDGRPTVRKSPPQPGWGGVHCAGIFRLVPP